jgi:uncharacterized protein (TIGR03437 family)
MAVCLVTAAAGQNFDTSGNGSLKGDYFVREVLITGQNTNGGISSATSVIGVATFDGAGNYKFTGQTSSTGALGTATPKTSTGSYGAAANGLFYMQSVVDSTQYAYGGVSAIGPSAIVASATENSNNDILIAIPAGANIGAAAFKGAYTAGYIDFPNADVTMVRQATLSLNADGAGNLGSVAVTGTALNLGGKQTMQTVPAVTYTLAGEGVGVANFGAASTSQLISGTKTFYLSADGNIILAANPAGFDLMVGLRSFSGSATNASWSGEYFTAGFEDTVTGGTTTTHALDAFYGSWNSTGQGTAVAHDRFQTFTPSEQVFDYTFNTQYSVQTNGTVTPSDLSYQFTLGLNGQGFIATGTGGLYTLLVGFGTPKYSGPGVYLNPLGVVNAANYAPITNPVAPGEIVTLFGSGLASGNATATTFPLPTTLAGTQVTINGQAAPLYYVTPTQIALFVPQAIGPNNNVNNATFKVINNGTTSNAVTVYTNYTAPGVFSANGNGIGAAAAQHADYSLITSSNPAKIGDTVVLYGGGLGTVTPAVADGAPAPSNPPAKIDDMDYVDFGGQQQTIAFAGLTPGLAGLYQLNTTIVNGTASGDQFVNVSTPDAYTSQTTIAVAGSSTAMLRRSALATHLANSTKPMSRALSGRARRGL